MIERRPYLSIVRHTVLIVAIAVVLFPVYVAFVASTLSFEEVLHVPMQLWPGGHLLENYAAVIAHGSAKGSSAPVGTMMFNSLVMALVIAIGKIAISIISAFAIVYFRFPLRRTFFWMIFITLMLPVEVRILPTYQVAANLNLIDTYAGLTLPLIASATATFLFRQFFLTIPDELRRGRAHRRRRAAALLLGRGAAAVAHQHRGAVRDHVHLRLEPVSLAAPRDRRRRACTRSVIGIKRMIPGGDAAAEWHLVMATAMLAMLPPALVVLLMQKWFVKGLVETEK